MAKSFPAFHNLDEFKCNNPKHVKLIGSCSAGPIIGIPGLCSLITLSFLFPVQNIKVLKTRLTKLSCEESGVREIIQDEEVKTLYDFLSKYNPFQNRRSCFRNDIFFKVVEHFERIMIFRMQGKISSNVSNIADVFRAMEEQIEQLRDFLIKEASDFLRCNIALCDVVHRNIDIFSECSDKVLSDHSLLTLYVTYEKNTSPFLKSYTIGIQHELGKKLREKAIKAILHEGNFSSGTIKHMTPFCSLNSNIILKLFNKNMVSKVSSLFRQPSVLLKITEAGCVVDPSIRDDKGKSALHYAIETDNKNIALKFCSYLLEVQSETFFPNTTPPSSIEEFFLRNLQHLNSVLSEHKSKFEQTLPSSAEPIIFLQQLLKMNSFQIDIAEKLMKVVTSTTDSGNDSLRMAVVNQERIVMNAVLSSYADYFTYEGSLTRDQKSPGIMDLENFSFYASSFKRCEWYYRMLDLRTALLFFDNLFSLKQGLNIGNSAYEEPESAFFHFVFTSHFFQVKRFSLFESLLPKSERKKLMIDKSCFFNIISVERLRCFEKLQAFNGILSTTVVQKDNTNQNVHDSSTEPLKSLPEIRDVINFRAVIYYLSVVSELKHRLCLTKSTVNELAVLVIERALQVVGESLHERFTENVSLGKSLLVSTLPIEVRKILRDIRDNLSHVDHKKSEGRKRVESNREIFLGIIEELGNIKSRFQRSYFVLELIEYEYMFQKGYTRLKEMQLMLRQSNDSDNPKSKQCITELSENITKDIHSLKTANHTIQNVTCTFRQHYMEHLKAHFEYVVHYSSGLLKISKPESRSKIWFHLKCSDVLLEHFLKSREENLDTARKEILNLMDDLKDIAAGNTKDEISEETAQEIIKDKIEGVMKMCQSVCKEEQSHRKSSLKELDKSRKEPRGVVPQKRECSQPTERSIGNKMQHRLISKKKSRGCTKRISKMERPARGSNADTSPHQSGEITDYPNILKLANSLQCFYPITTEEQYFVLNSVSSKFKENSDAKLSLEQAFISLLDGQKTLNDDVRSEIESQIGRLVESRQKLSLKDDFAQQCLIKNNLDIVRSIRDDYGDLKERFRKNEMIDSKDFERYCKSVALIEEAKIILKKCVKGQPFRSGNDAMLTYLRDKVLVLEDLLVKSNAKLDRMSKEFRSLVTSQQIFFLVKERYLQDRILQGAIEMLLFDCMNILKHRRDLKWLWIKATNLFSGINLRNILAHGNPLFQQVGLMLDPSDLPSEIISKCLELVNDRKAIQAMCTLLEGTDGTRDTLFAKVSAREPGSKKLRDVITATEKWKDYALLLPCKSSAEQS